MNLLKKIIVLGLLSVLSIGANAEFIEADYLVGGDDLSTLHVETGIEWLDFSVTKGMSMQEVIDQLDTTFYGWRIPTKLEVNRNESTQTFTIKLKQVGDGFIFR